MIQALTNTLFIYDYTIYDSYTNERFNRHISSGIDSAMKNEQNKILYLNDGSDIRVKALLLQTLYANTNTMEAEDFIEYMKNKRIHTSYRNIIIFYERILYRKENIDKFKTMIEGMKNIYDSVSIFIPDYCTHGADSKKYQFLFQLLKNIVKINIDNFNIVYDER